MSEQEGLECRLSEIGGEFVLASTRGGCQV